MTFVFLLVDRLCWNPETGRQHPDAFVRFLSALGHEIYGNVATQLRLEFGKLPAGGDAERCADELAAFEAGIAFLERLRASKFQQGIPASHITSALRREKAALKIWKKRNCGYLLGGPGEQHFVD